MPKQKRPGVQIRFGTDGQMIRRKRRLTKEEAVAKVQAAAPAVAKIRAGAEARATTLPIDAAAAAEQRHSAYLRQIAARRAAAAGGEGKAAEREQADIYRTLGVDRRAGFDGRPPAFRILKQDRTDSGEMLVQAKNVARDPVRILWNQGAITKRQYVAAVALADLLEQQASIGVRAMAFSEFVDGGRAPDVSIHALAIARRMAAWERAFSGQERGLLRAITIEGQTVSDLARGGVYGANRARVKEKLTAALERLADWLEVR